MTEKIRELEGRIKNLQARRRQLQSILSEVDEEIFNLWAEIDAEFDAYWKREFSDLKEIK